LRTFLPLKRCSFVAHRAVTDPLLLRRLVKVKEK
jgi:hypothetical protein